ncbi:hypothetical protein Emed_003631 [Eimeria media]
MALLSWKTKTSTKLFFLPFLFAAITSSFVSGWSDEGHLLVATIAKLLLAPAELEHIEAILSKWNDDFPGTGSLQTAAIWLDHLSCKEPSPYCSGFKALDDVQVFRTWHYSTHVFNPQNLELNGVYKYYPLPKTGAEWALSTVYESLKEVEPQAISAILSKSTKDENNDNKEQHATPNNRGSPFSLNLHLRLLLHIFGDLHQPLHAGSLFARGFPDGDEGGNAGLVLRESIFYFREIMKEFPRETLTDRLSGRLAGTDFAAIGQESAAVALKAAYSEFNWETFSKDSLPYFPTDGYMERTRQEAKLQIAIGGYRLAHLLSTLAKEFMRSPEQQQQQQKQKQQQQQQQQQHQQQQEQQQPQPQQQLMEALREDWVKLKRAVERGISIFSRLAAPHLGRAEPEAESVSNSSKNSSSSNSSSSNSSNSNSSSSSSSSEDGRVSEASDSPPSSSSLLSSLQPLPKLLLQVAGATVTSWSLNEKPAEGKGAPPSSSGAPLHEEGPLKERRIAAAAVKAETQEKKNSQQQQEATEEKAEELNVAEL